MQVSSTKCFTKLLFLIQWWDLMLFLKSVSTSSWWHLGHCQTLLNSIYLLEILIIDSWFLFESTRNALFQRNVMFAYHSLHVISEPVSIDRGCGENTLFKDLKILTSRIHSSLPYTSYKFLFRPCQLFFFLNCVRVNWGQRLYLICLFSHH